ncbi:hypothetical protein CEXT_588241 [Caerostris extrusa]|uniref:Uncharacterized protein n=1 Tax=Caerostris extrusa TaxID=172846 RepID=A0AAV4Q4M5_CAEEX|nr:hypothetical protein CEXT_588241 [Caerostris extrusa]
MPKRSENEVFHVYARDGNYLAIHKKIVSFSFNMMGGVCILIRWLTILQKSPLWVGVCRLGIAVAKRTFQASRLHRTPPNNAVKNYLGLKFVAFELGGIYDYQRNYYYLNEIKNIHYQNFDQYVFYLSQ